MGWGDYLMASGHVRRIKKNNPQTQVLISIPRWSLGRFSGQPHKLHTRTSQVAKRDRAHRACACSCALHAIIKKQTTSNHINK